MTHVDLTLLDGTQLSVAYPEDLDLTSHGVDVQTVGSLNGDHSRVFGVRYGSPESFVARTEETSGPGQLATTFPGTDGRVVERWEFPAEPIAYLVYDFDPWTVYVWDGMGEANLSMGDPAQLDWSRNLNGSITSKGFLVLTATRPLELVNAVDDPGPDGPDIRVDGESGGLLVFVNDCDRMTSLDEETYGREVFAFCDKPTNTLFFVAGNADVQQRIHEALVVNPSRPEDSAVDAPPILEQATKSSVYLSTDNRLTVVDVDAHSAAVHELPELAPGDPLFRLVRRGDVLVFYGQIDAGPAVFALDPRDPSSPSLIDEAWFFIPSAIEDRVWLAILDESSPATVRALESVREVTVDGVVTTEDVPAPDGRWPVASVEDGLVFQGDDVLEIWDPVTQAFVETLPGPFPVATWRNRIVTCGQCDELHLIDLQTHTQRTIDLPDRVVSVDGYGGAFSPDGRYVAVPGFDSTGPLTPETGVSLVIIDFEAGTAASVPGTSHDQFDDQVAWSSDGEWLFVTIGSSDGKGGQLLAYHPGDDTAYRIPVVLDGPYYGMVAD